MAKSKPKSPIKYAAFHVKKDSDGKPRKNRDGSLSILALIRYPKQLPFSETFRSMADAEEWATARIRELEKQKGRSLRPELAKLTIKQLINQYLDDPNIKMKKSYEFYCDLANWWIKNYGTEKIYNVAAPLLHEARDFLQSSGSAKKPWSAATVNRYLAVMRLIWNWGKAAGWIAPDRTWPTSLLLTEPKGRNRFLSAPELNTLLKVAESSTVMRAAILVSVATGLRRGELLRLKWADIDIKESAATIHETKNKTPRRVHLTAQAVLALKTLWPDGKAPAPAANVFLLPDGKPFEAYHLEGRWRYIRKAAKLEDFRWHDLRHTCASYLAQNGATLLEIGSVLGHKTPAMTQRYSHLVPAAPLKAHAGLNERLKGE